MIDLSISIINTSNWKYLEPCIQAIMDNTFNITYEILVVDNASEDGSVDLVRKNFPNVIQTINPQRFGFAKNNNINLRKSSGRYLMLLNDDTLVQNGSLDIAIKYMDDHPDIGMVGCKMINPDGTFQPTSARRFQTLLSTLFSESGLRWRFKKLFPPDENTIREIDLPQESGMIMRRAVLDKVGLLDERFFMFGEGADFCRRVKRAGWKIVFLPDCRIVHFGDTTNKRASLKMFIQSYKSTYLYFGKESMVTARFYRLLILMIYTIKYLMMRVWYALTRREELLQILKYHHALIDFMLTGINDPQHPYPTTGGSNDRSAKAGIREQD
jgi:GT2 family glycosyltransferase